MPLVGDAKREYQKNYMRRQRDIKIERAAQSLVGDFIPRPGRPLKLTEEEKDRKTEALKQACRSHGLDLDLLAREAAENIKSNKIIVVAGEAITVRDNNARIQAWPQALELLQMADVAPQKVQGSAIGGSHVTVNVMMLNEKHANAES